MVDFPMIFPWKIHGKRASPRERSEASHRPHCGAGAPAWRRCAEAADVFFFLEKWTWNTWWRDILEDTWWIWMKYWMKYWMKLDVGWCFGTWIFWFFILWISSSQLTNSYFSEG
jgi:hypothetical protein